MSSAESMMLSMYSLRSACSSVAETKSLAKNVIAIVFSILKDLPNKKK